MEGSTGVSGLLRRRELVKHSCCSTERLAATSVRATASPRHLYTHKRRAVWPMSPSGSRTLPSSPLVVFSPRAAASTCQLWLSSLTSAASDEYNCDFMAQRRN